MNIRGSRYAAVLASAAALSMIATPALADGWGGGYGGGYGGWGHHHDNTGWIVGGIIGIGMIAAIAAAASKNQHDRQARSSGGGYQGDGYQGGEYRGEDYRGGDDSRAYGRGAEGYDRGVQSYSGSNRNIDGAVDACVGEVERGSTRVDTVDDVASANDGWRISGHAEGGRDFACMADSNGRIRSVTVDGHSVS